MEVGGCSFPGDSLYDPEGLTWVRLSDDDNRYTIGITPLQAFMIGKVSSVVMKPKGSELSVGRSVAYLETPRYAGNLRVTLSSVLEEINDEIVSNPSALNTDPYGRGWVARLRAVNLDAEKGGLLDSDSACESVKKVVKERGIRCFSVYPEYQVSRIGGECPETLRSLDEVLESASANSAALLVTDNPKAEQDVPSWTSTRGYAILERRVEDALKYFIIRKG